MSQPEHILRAKADYALNVCANVCRAKDKRGGSGREFFASEIPAMGFPALPPRAFVSLSKRGFIEASMRAGDGTVLWQFTKAGAEAAGLTATARNAAIISSLKAGAGWEDLVARTRGWGSCALDERAARRLVWGWHGRGAA